jgi:uncharacterized membrane protein YphA (DoxX/SURF4 family)
VIKRLLSSRVISPAGLLLALLCLGLPFVTVSCESSIVSVSADYSGWDFVFGGEPDITESVPSEAPASKPQDASTPLQPLALLAFIAVVAGIVLSLAMPRQRMTSAVAAGSAALLLFVNQIVVRSHMVDELQKGTFLSPRMADDMIESRFGYWLTLLLLLGVAGHGAVEVAHQHHPRTSTNPAERDQLPP